MRASVIARQDERHGARGRRWLVGAVLATGALALTGAAAATVVLATSGVFDRRPGAWTVPLRVLPGVTVEANASGLVRLATSPIGLRLLDGQSTTTALGVLHFARDGSALAVRCAPCRVNDARIAPRMVALPPTELRLARRAGVESNNVVDARVSAADVHGSAVLTLAPAGVDVQWQLPPSALAAVVAVLGDAVPEARRASIDGSVWAEGRFSLPLARPTLRLQLDQVAVRGLGTEALADGTVTFDCRDARGAPRSTTIGAQDRQWVPADAFGTWLPQALLAAEDPHFRVHGGFDAATLQRALSGLPPGRGTLTQQLVRTLHGTGDGSLASVLRELLYASEMERTLGKDRILALVMNTADWGPGACGARAAARLYFGKRVPQLSPLEAAWLAGILRDPQRAYQQQVLGGVVDHERTQWVLAQLRELPRAERDKWRRLPLVFQARVSNGARPALAVAGQATP
jgi:hypothetical protein